jgi:natural resistance-associated macrophage protein 2
MAICFWANMFIVRPGVGSVLGGFVPLVPNNSTNELIGLIGAVIMPHNLFLHSALVQSRNVDCRDPRKVREANKYFSIEAGISLLVSFFINMSVIATFAYYHLKPGSGDIYLENAHHSLEQSFGKGAKLIWAIGLMAAGQSSTMTGTYAGQFVMQGFINLHLPSYVRVLVTRAIAIVPALIVTFIGNLDNFDGYLNILQAVQLPFALIPLLKFSASIRVMSQFKNSMLINIFCIVLSVVLIALNLYGLIPRTKSGWVIALVVIFALVYFAIIVIVIICPVRELAPLEDKSDGNPLTKSKKENKKDIDETNDQGNQTSSDSR